MAKAQPPVRKVAPPPARPKKITAAVATEMAEPPKTQDEFRGAGVQMASELGWELTGDAQPNWQIGATDENPLGGIRIDDAQNYLTKVAHEVHVAAHCPQRCKAPTTEDVCRHLSIASQEESAKVEAWLSQLAQTEAR